MPFLTLRYITSLTCSVLSFLCDTIYPGSFVLSEAPLHLLVPFSVVDSCFVLQPLRSRTSYLLFQFPPSLDLSPAFCANPALTLLLPAPILSVLFQCMLLLRSGYSLFWLSSAPISFWADVWRILNLFLSSSWNCRLITGSLNLLSSNLGTTQIRAHALSPLQQTLFRIVRLILL